MSSPVCVTLWLFWSFSGRTGRLCRPLDSSRLLSLSLVILSLSCLDLFVPLQLFCLSLQLFAVIFSSFYGHFLQLYLVSDVSLYPFLVVCVFYSFQAFSLFFNHSFIWSFVLVVCFVTLIVSHPLKFSLWQIFLLVIFLILSSSFPAFVFFHWFLVLLL